jgi:2-amino-4-hydroxy-6-hydroxymethyldihydropteridine diphosphokinase
MRSRDRREPPASPEPNAAKVEGAKTQAAKIHAAKTQAAKIQAALGLGGNVGDVRAAFTRALAALADAPGVEILRKSSLYRTAPWGPVAQPPFLNMAVLVRTTLSPHHLLDLCLSIERQEGRVRAERFGPRTLDVDILAFGGLVLSDERLTLPHPRLLERAFALVPLAEIAPELMIGGVGVGTAAESLDRTGIERLDA